MRRWMPSVRRQPLRCNSSAVARTPGPPPALRALRWPPRLSQKYTRRDGFGTRPYQRGERQSCGPPAPPAPPPALRAALTPGPSPALRAALTPGPSPALRERGDLMDAASLQDADAGSLLRREPPLPLPVGERKGAGEKVWWHTPLPLPQRGRGRGLGGR